MYCSMPKDICWAKATSNSERIMPIALAIIKLRLSEGISQLLSQSVRRLVGRLVGLSVSQSVSQSVSH